MNDLVTIIIPIYNSEKYIKRCVDSILKQTYKTIEVLLINDGSKDNSVDVVKKIKDKRIRLIDKENEGVSKTRNLGIKEAKGKYIIFIDNDDFIDKDYVENHVKAIGDNDVLISGYRRPNNDGKIIKELKLEETEWSKLMVLAPWAKIYRKDYLIDNKIEFLTNNIGEDVYFNLYALLYSKKVKIIDYVGYNWFYNEESVSNTIQKDFRDIRVFYLLDKCYEIVDEKDILKDNYQLVEMHFIRYIMWFLSYSTKRRKFKEISEVYDKLFNWLKEKFPNYKKNELIGFRKPKGEIRSVRFLYVSFMIAHKIKLGKLLVFLYSKI